NHPIAITDLPLEVEAPTTGALDVVVDSFSFAPQTTAVAVGATVTWTNRDDVPHNIVSTQQKFKSPVLDTDERFSHRFDTPGTYPYFCSIHPKMTGQVVVGGGMRLAALVATAAVAIVIVAAHASRAAQPVHELSITAKNFAFEPAEIQVVAGEPVRLVVRSGDSVHGFAIPALKIDLQVPSGGDPVVAEFIAPPAGRYEVACSEFCGRGHGRMKAALVSTAPVQTNR